MKLLALPAHLAARRPAWLDVLICGFLPGALTGTLLSGLLFFLNPDLSLTPLSLVRMAFAYGGLLGLGSLLVELPFTYRQPRRARRLLPWGLTAAMTVTAILYGGHASYFAFYLPPGINERLIRASLPLSAMALVAFYTALLHSVHRRRYGRRSQWLFVVLCILSVYVMVERRQAFRPSPQRPRLSTPATEVARPQLLFVGLESATLDAILPLAEQGRLPFIATMLREGTYGRLACLEPYRRTSMWASLATGKYPYKHGLVDNRLYPLGWLTDGQPLRLLPAWMAFRRWGTLGFAALPVDQRSSRSLNLWQILNRQGLAAGMVAWPNTNPVPEELSFALSEPFFDEPQTPESSWPGEVAERALLFQLSVEDIDPQLVARFGADPGPEVLEALAGDLWRESLTMFLLEHHRDAQALFLVLPGLRKVSRSYYGGYSAAQFEGSQQASEQRAAEIVSAYYNHLDSFLNQLWLRSEGPKVLVLASAGGMQEFRGLRRAWRWLWPQSLLDGTQQASPDGALLLYGTGIRPATQLSDAELVDVVPTLLYGLGYPVARDLDGKVLTSAFQPALLAQQPLTFVPSYEPQPP